MGIEIGDKYPPRCTLMTGNPHGYWVSRITHDRRSEFNFIYKYFSEGPGCVIGGGGWTGWTGCLPF